MLELQNKEREASPDHRDILVRSGNTTVDYDSVHSGLGQYHNRAIRRDRDEFLSEKETDQSKDWPQIDGELAARISSDNRTVTVSEELDDLDLETRIEYLKMSPQIDKEVIRYSIEEEARNLIEQVTEQDGSPRFDPLEIVAVLYATRWVDLEDHDVREDLREFASDEEVSTVIESDEDSISSLFELGTRVEEFLEWYPNLYEQGRERTDTEEQIAERFLKAFLTEKLP